MVTCRLTTACDNYDAKKKQTLTGIETNTSKLNGVSYFFAQAAQNPFRD
jgi:hypothetical protein